MKKILTLVLAGLMTFPALADEGMWLPMLLNRTYEDMKENGLKLSPEDLYAINQASLKDAIVSFGGFCTGEIISDQGLILTNHHCGYGAIQANSSQENNYLRDGFWAMTKDQELPNDGLFVRFLVRMEDVTDQVSAALTDEMSEGERRQAIATISRSITDSVSAGGQYEANVKSFYHGNEFYLFIYEVYNDVRLVGTPPEAIGKFGGDTDNWMWPRHTGDFSLFRVYAGPDGKPAEYSEANVPLRPRHHLPVSVAGVQPGDFTMVFGFPGSTDRYLTSHGVKQAIEKYNPSVVEIRDQKLAIMREYMNADEAIDLAYSSKYAQVANYWKYYIGQTEQLKSNKVYDKKLAIEQDFRQWVAADAQRVARYGETLDMFADAYATKDSYVRSSVYILEAGLLGADIGLFGFRSGRLFDALIQSQGAMQKALEEAKSDAERDSINTAYSGRMASIKGRLLSAAKEHFEGYSAALDRDLLASLTEMYATNIDQEQWPAYFDTIAKYYDGNYEAWADSVFAHSALASMEKLEAFLQDSVSKEHIEADPAIAFGESMFNSYRMGSSAYAENEAKLDKAYRLFTAGLREMNPEKAYYPDANSTMRMTWGTVSGYEARDAVTYRYYTTQEGIMQKMDNDNPEFIVPQKLEELIRKGDFGRYANEQGELPICFLHNTDITGGNSGSPVINGHGELIGLAFDGNWEAMSGDIFFEDELQRTISVDARYVLFVIDKVAGAGHLVDEMTLVTKDHHNKGFLWF